MPPKSKRKLQLKNARESKRTKLLGTVSSTETAEEAVESENETVDGEESFLSFCESEYCSSEDEDYEETAEKLDEDTAIHLHAVDWVNALEKDDIMSLTLLLHDLLVTRMHLNATDAAKLIGEMVMKSDRTVREWRTMFLANDNEFPDTQQGKYRRSGVLWQNEDLNRKARQYVRENANVKGRPNMTATSFCRWVNLELFPSQVLDPGYPRRISVETARKWLHHLDFHVLDQKKGVYIDGHERDDVVDYRKKFLRKMTAIGFLNKDNAPTSEAASCLPIDLHCPPPEQLKKTIVIFHDESIFNSNEDQSVQWGTHDMVTIKPKGKGSGIMVSDFITEEGYLRLTEEEVIRARAKHGDKFWREARELLEYGESKDGYWTSERFLKQMDEAVKIADIKYPRSEGYRVNWLFDHSSCHNAYSEDALNATHMNAKPGGKQPCMRDTVWKGKVQRMVFSLGIPKGLIQVLKERGCYRKKMKLEDMRKEISTHSDFQNEKTKLEHFLNDRGHACIMLPKFHCEFNPIERCWGQAKKYTRAYTNYTFPRLRQNIPNALDSVTQDMLQNFFRKARQYMFAHLEGLKAGPEMEKQVKKYSKVFKSHRRVGVND